MPRPEPVHTHPVAGSCLANCPRWQWEWERQGRELRVESYYIRKDIDTMLEHAFLDSHDFESLGKLRAFQQEHPNRWPRL